MTDRTKRNIGYVFLYVGFIALFSFYSYIIEITAKPMGMFLFSCFALILFILYVLINHIFVRRVIPTRVLIIFESLLIIALLTVYESNIDDWSRY